MFFSQLDDLKPFLNATDATGDGLQVVYSRRNQGGKHLGRALRLAVGYFYPGLIAQLLNFVQCR